MNSSDEVAKREEERLARSLNRIPNRRSTFNTKQSSPVANTSSSNSTTPTTTPTKTEPRQRPLSQQIRSPLTYNTPPPSSSTTPQRTIERSSSTESKSQEESSTTTTNETVSTHSTSSSSTTTPATENDRHVITGVRSNSIKEMIEREESRLAKLFDSPSPSDVRRKSASFVVRSPSQGSTPTPSPGLARRPTVAASFTKSPSYTGSTSNSNTPQRLTSSSSHDGTSSPVSTPSKTEPIPSSSASSTSSSTPAPAPSTPAPSSTTTSVPSTSPSNSNPTSPASNRKPASTNTTPQKDKPAVLKELDDLLSSVNQTAAASHNRRASVNLGSPSTPTKAAPKQEEPALSYSSSNDFDDIMEVLTELGQTPVPKAAPAKTESASSSTIIVHSNSSSNAAASNSAPPAAEQKKMPVDVSELESDLDALLKKHQDAYKKAEQLLHQVHVEQQPHPTPAPAQAPAPAPSPAPPVNDRSKAISSLDDILNTLNAAPTPAPVAVVKPAEVKPAEPAKSSTPTQPVSTSTSANATTSSAPPATVKEPAPAPAQPAQPAQPVAAPKQAIERRRSILLEKPPAPMTQEEVNRLLTDVVSTGKQIVAILNNASHPSAFDAQRFGLLATSVIKNMTYSINGLPIDETTRANLIHQTRELASECHAFALTSDIGAITVDHFQRDQDKIRESLLTLFKSLKNIKDNASNPSKPANATVALPPRGASLSKEVGDLAHEILAILKEPSHDNDRFSSKLQQFVRTVKANLNTFPDSEITLKNNLIDQLKTLLHKGIELNTHDGALSYKIEFVENITAFLKSGRF